MHQCHAELHVMLTSLWDDLFRVCSGLDHAEAVLLAAFPFSRVPVVSATAYVVPFLIDPAAGLGRMSPWHIKLQWLVLSQRSCLVWRLRCAPAAARPRPRLCWHSFACLPGPPSKRGCSASGQGMILSRTACLRLIPFCTCLPLCVGALWPMPAWVLRDVRSVFLTFFLDPFVTGYRCEMQVIHAFDMHERGIAAMIWS